MSGNGDQNLFDLTENAINQLKKQELVKKNIKIEWQSDCWCRYLWFMWQIKILTETVSELLDKYDQLNSVLLVCKKGNKHLEEKVTKLENPL